MRRAESPFRLEKRFSGKQIGLEKYSSDPVSSPEPSGLASTCLPDALPFWHLLACPACGGALVARSRAVTCAVCAENFVSEDRPAQLDLRLRGEKSYVRTVTVGGEKGPPPGTVVDELAPDSAPAMPNWPNVRIPSELAYGNRLTPELLSYAPHADGPGQWMLDLGCGSGASRTLFEALTRLAYLGVDQAGNAADVLVDAHALPFKDKSFDFAVCIAVLEHLEVPDIAMSEAFRVLKPGGTFIGTGAFLEPFHLNSYEHMTHLGVYRTLRDAGFEVITIAPNREWSGLRALAEMSLFPIGMLPYWLRRVPIAPVELLHRSAWALKRAVGRADRASELQRLLETTAGFRFVARRPA